MNLRKYINEGNACLALAIILVIGNFRYLSSSPKSREKNNTVLSLQSDSFNKEIELDTPYFNISDYVDDVSHKFSQYLKRAEISNEEKIDVILNRYNITCDQLIIIQAICTAEAGASRINDENYNKDRYEEARKVTATLFNRICRNANIKDVNDYFGEGCGTNLFYQVIYPNAYTPYQHEQYLNYLNDTPETQDAFQAVIDFLYDPDPHNFLAFKGDGFQKEGYIQLVNNGNWYFYEISGEDLVTRDTLVASIKAENLFSNHEYRMKRILAK